MQIELISTSVEDKGKYKMMLVTYRNSDGKLSEKKLMSFGGGADVYNFLKTAEPAKYDVVTKQNDKGYWDWISISPAGTVPVAAKSGGSASPAPRSTYETPEERAQRQILIVRQSSLSSAIEFFAMGGKKSVTTTEVIQVAKEFENFVFGKSVDVESGITELEDDIL
jgi:hypothetical protein